MQAVIDAINSNASALSGSACSSAHDELTRQPPGPLAHAGPGPDNCIAIGNR